MMVTDCLVGHALGIGGSAHPPALDMYLGSGGHPQTPGRGQSPLHPRLGACGVLAGWCNLLGWVVV